MTQPPAPPALLRWGPLVAFGLLLVALSRHAGEGISDPDTLWHILAGDHLWRTGSFSGPDPLSDFTVHPWVLNQWLPDLGLALANHLGGLAAVAWVTQLGRLLVCVAIFVLCRLVAGPLPASLVAALAILGTTDSLSPRPQLVGFVLLAVVVGAWLRTAEDGRARWWLVPLMWLWASSHGTWVVGLSVSAAATVGLVLDRRPPRAQALRWVAVVLAGAAVTAVTPVGPRLYESFATVRAVSPYISEWRHPTLSSLSVAATAALAVLVLLLWASSRTHPGWTRIALWVVGVGWAAMSMRSVAIGAIILAPLAAEALGTGLRRPRTVVTRGERRLVGGALVASLVLAGVLAAAGPREPVGVPAALDPSLDALPHGSVVFNSDLLGGWMMWAHPDLRHTSDTRAELYGPARARAYLRILATQPGWRTDFDALAPRAALVAEPSPLARALTEGGWHVSGRDAGYVLLVPGRG
ncbi:hypothetical protein BJ986_002172 [Phycicoccus badiiscoriae]|uniref:Glycosyltransferase RgtA/B/C/D-like domain-containing protein n=1 Tax=Pedococcus badiiscoriae TaxID=642776 RepID=A0A852WN80_9MICO|nr:hypothetical protein [Pedococcus badiiscoriae]NYG07685.1 hypothetical protein [Pedococcus badiiscoriae]